MGSLGSNSNVSRTTRISVQQGGRSQGSVNVQAQENARRRQIASDEDFALGLWRAHQNKQRHIAYDEVLARSIQLEEERRLLNFARQQQRVDVSNNNNNSHDTGILDVLLNAPDQVHPNEEYEECPIGMDNTANMLSSCGGQICKTCWGKAIAGQIMCPFCRAGENVNA